MKETTMLRRHRQPILLLVLACLAVGSRAMPAVAGDGQWHLRAQAVWTHPDLTWQSSPEPGDLVTVDADDAFGLAVSGEYQVSELLGVDLGIMRTTPDVRVRSEDSELGLSVSATDGLTMTPLSIGLNFHLTPSKSFDLYLGPFLAYVLYSDLQWTANATIDVGSVPIVVEDSLRMSVANDLAYGAVAGADIPIGSRRWFLSGTLRYMATELDATNPEGAGENLSLDPLIVTLGVRYSF
jgi:outer membrane protein W